MGSTKEKNGITLLALVITIVIMLLLAGVALQMTMGENGLIGKSAQAQKAQAKSELYETAKLSYANLRAKAAENGQPNPQVELALSTTEFRDRYDIVGDDITDKNGNVIDKKVNVLNVIQGTIAGGFSSGTSIGGTSSAESWPKTVGGVTIQEEDKDKMILKLKVKSNTTVPFGGISYTIFRNIDPIEVDYGNGEKGEITDLYTYIDKGYNQGEYILKFKNVKDFSLREFGDFEIEVLQWGKILENNEENIIRIANVSKIYEPEPDRIPINYLKSKLTEIPEWLFSKKVTSTVMSKFTLNDTIVNIPEGLFKNNVNVINFDYVFVDFLTLTNIPEGLFKNDVNAKSFEHVFSGCRSLTNIPEELFNNNVNATSFTGVFYGCIALTNIPEGLFKNNLNVTSFDKEFYGCIGLTNIPGKLFKHNINASKFVSVFEYCTGITSIPDGLFKYNINVSKFVSVFKDCSGLINIPGDIVEFAKKVKDNGGNVKTIFKNCTSASNYSSIPNYMK